MLEKQKLMIKKSFVFIIMLLVISCKEKEIEFYQSETMNLVLVKNLPQNDSLLKEELKKYLISQKIEHTEIYEYSWDTEYFLTHEEDDGGPTSSHFLDLHQEERGIAYFYKEKCKNDSLKTIGVIRYYDKYGYFYHPDTIIGKCK